MSRERSVRATKAPRGNTYTVPVITAATRGAIRFEARSEVQRRMGTAQDASQVSPKEVFRSVSIGRRGGHVRPPNGRSAGTTRHPLAGRPIGARTVLSEVDR